MDEEPAPPPAKIVVPGLSQERQRQLLEEALTRLPADFREVLLLVEIERWSYQAIAAALHEPVEAVIARLGIARRRLQKELTSLHQVSDSRSDDPRRTGGDQNGLRAMQCEPHGRSGSEHFHYDIGDP